MSKKPDQGPVDLERIRELIDLLIEKDVEELEIERSGVKVKIRRRDDRAPVAVSPAQQPISAAAPAPVPAMT